MRKFSFCLTSNYSDLSYKVLQQTAFIQQLQSGDAAAFRTLIDTYQDQVFNLCLGFVHRSEDAEDLAQEVFVEAYRSVDNYRGDAQLGTWLYRIATNKSLEWIRYNQRKKRLAFFQAKRGEDAGLENIGDMEAHPGVQLENQERSKILFWAIDQLPLKQRTAFTLHKVEGLSYQEVSQVMEMSLSSVESLMFRAKKNLKKKLIAYYTS